MQMGIAPVHVPITTALTALTDVSVTGGTTGDVLADLSAAAGERSDIYDY